ncbi:MAG: dockerin type I domain-containing protein [Candidatus Paceibacterota bacterium]
MNRIFFSITLFCISFGLLYPFSLSAITIGVASTTIRVSICGDGIVNQGEDCDPPGSGNYSTSIAGRECNSLCEWAPYCGDSVVQTSFGEECDDGNNTSKDFCSAECLAEEIVLNTGGGGGGGGAGIFPGGSFAPPSNSDVTITGKAYPNSTVTILKDGEVIGEVATDSNADFLFTTSGITPGTATFGFWAEDSKGLRSISYTTTFEVIQSAVTTVSGVYLPPTIRVEPRSLDRGDTLTIDGTSVPDAVITAQISGDDEYLETVTAETDGSWELLFDTSPIPNDSYTARASFRRSDTNGLTIESGFGQALSFFVGVDAVPDTGPSDLNLDGRINIVDFSIMLFHWGTDGAGSSPSADINGDGRVNLTDFSIMIFNWTG